MSEVYENIIIPKLPIRLGQFLKLANIAQDGIEAAHRIQQGEIMVNGEIETKRGRKLHARDEISCCGKKWRIDSHP